MRATWLAWAIGGLLATALAGTSVRAQEATGFESMFDVAFGGTVTTDYMSRGTTQTDGGPAIQGYAEADLNNFYVGLFAANVNYGFDDTEIDLSAGWRPEWNDVSFDFGYIHYFYVTDSGSAYGEFYAQADWATNDWLTVGGKIYYAPDYVQSDTSAVYGEANSEIALPWNWSLSGRGRLPGVRRSLRLELLDVERRLHLALEGRGVLRRPLLGHGPDARGVPRHQHAGELLRRAGRRIAFLRHFLVGAARTDRHGSLRRATTVIAGALRPIVRQS